MTLVGLTLKNGLYGNCVRHFWAKCPDYYSCPFHQKCHSLSKQVHRRHDLPWSIALWSGAVQSIKWPTSPRVGSWPSTASHARFLDLYLLVRSAPIVNVGAWEPRFEPATHCLSVYWSDDIFGRDKPKRPNSKDRRAQEKCERARS